MIGFQCAPNPAPGAGKSVDQQQQQAAAPSGASSPASRRSSASSSSSSSSSCSTGSSPRDLAGRLHQQLPSIQQHSSHSLSSNSKHLHNNGTGEQCAEERELRAASPGYHSAAPSPGGSTSSSIASPISSSASTSSTSVCSSSGISTASLLSAAAAHSSAALLQQQSPITTTARSTHRPSHPQHQHHQLHPPTSNNVGPSLAPHQMSQQLEAPHMQQQTNSYEPMVRTQQQQHQRNNNQQRQANGLGALLDHFVQAHHEPLNLSWFHEANNRAALNAALSSTKLMVAGDISLAEMSRYPVPIMARPPLGVSDLTLENWITDVLQARKGIKLTFTSTRTVEPAFRVLARHADQLRGPLVLSADVLAWPQAGGLQGARNQAPSNKQQQQQQPVDAWTFLMLCRTRFPKSIISIGWCGGASSTCGQPCESSPADSNVGQPESMFELELLEQHSQGQHQFNSPVLHLSQAGRPQCHQPLALQPHGALLNRQLLQAGRAAQFGNPSCASNGSLNSSSGNSSGSPSPTSPVSSSSLFLGASAQSQAPRLRHHQRNQLPIGEPAGSSAEQLIMAAAAAAAAAAAHEHKSSGSPSSGQHLKGGWSAVAAAAMVAQLQQQHHHHQDQLPLNLNINEAAESQQAVASLQELAHTIQQLQQQSSSLESLSTSLHHQQQCSKATAAALALAGNIAQANATNPHTGHAHQLLIGQSREAHKWQHVNKKAAVSNRLHSNSPSPISTSPKQAPASAINLLTYVSSGANKLLNNAPSGQHNNNNKQQQPEVAGYTREMIDKMSSLVKEYNLTQAITFPVEARLLVRRHSAHFAHSLSELQRLLFQVGPNSTLTLVAQPEDLISADELLLIRKHFSPNQILFDLPGELAQAVRQHELSTSGGHR